MSQKLLVSPVSLALFAVEFDDLLKHVLHNSVCGLHALPGLMALRTRVYLCVLVLVLESGRLALGVADEAGFAGARLTLGTLEYLGDELEADGALEVLGPEAEACIHKEVLLRKTVGDVDHILCEL